VLFVVMGAVSLETITNLARQSRLLDEAHERVDTSRQIEHALAMQMNFTSMALIQKDEATIARILRENNRFNNTLARIEEAAPAEERELIQRIRAAQEEAMNTVADIANLVRDGKLDEAMELQLDREFPLYVQIEQLVNQVVKIEHEKMESFRRSVAAENQRALTLMGSFVGASILLALLLGLVLPFEPSPLLPPLTSLWSITHVALAFLGYAAFALTFCGGLMYLIQDRYLKAKHPAGFSSRLPSLEMLDRLNFWALACGLPLLTHGLVTGAIWARYARGSFWIWERTAWPFLVIWGIYALLFIGRWYLGWRGRRAAFAVVAGFCAVSIGYLMHTLG